MKQKAIIFGSGSKTKENINKMREEYEVIRIVDNDNSRWNTKLQDIDIKSPETLKEDDYEVVVLSNKMASVTTYWVEQMQNLGIDKPIDYRYCVYNADARVEFLKNFADMVYEKQLKGNVAEAGVFRGDFAKEINKYFYDRKLYLFDTFEGFSNEDLANTSINDTEGRFSGTSVDYVMGRMPNQEMVDIRKGYFPDSAVNVDDTFIFVNLDMDLEKPTRSGLDFFRGKIERGGIILVHDYYNTFFPGIKKCVDEWVRENSQFRILPIGDNMSVMIIGF